MEAEKLSLYIESRLVNQTEDKLKIYLYIQSIHKIPVKVYLIYYRTNNVFYLEVSTNINDFKNVEQIFQLPNDGPFIQDKKMVDRDNFLVMLENLVSSLEIDIYSGKFSISGVPKDTSFLLDLFDNSHIEFEFGKCCVCLQSTLTCTQCHHHLCVVCWSKLPTQFNGKQCPICRKVGIGSF